jgi:hypothetical protein
VCLVVVFFLLVGFLFLKAILLMKQTQQATRNWQQNFGPMPTPLPPIFFCTPVRSTMNEDCHLDAAPAPGQENNAAYAQCRLALSRQAARTGRQNPAAGTGLPGRAGVAGCA